MFYRKNTKSKYDELNRLAEVLMIFEQHRLKYFFKTR